MIMLDIFGKTKGADANPLSCVATDVVRQKNVVSVEIEYRKYSLSKPCQGQVCFEKNGTRLYQYFNGDNLGDVAKQVQDFCMALD